MQLIFYNIVKKCVSIFNRIISAHFVRVYLSGRRMVKHIDAECRVCMLVPL